MTQVIPFFGLGSLHGVFDFNDKDRNLTYYLQYMLNRTSQIFDYENLPETMPKRYVELYLQVNGHICVAEHEGDLYAFFGGFGGYPDAYYMPTQYVVANPYLKLNKIYDVGENCIVVPNDTMYLGLLPMFKRYASQMVENDISINIADYNARIVSLISAQDDNTKDSAKKYLEDIKDGKLGVIANTAFLDGLRTQQYQSGSQSNSITQLIELQQYLKASWFNEIGLNANYNMKREAINSNESQLNDDMLLPLVDDMYEQRKIYFDKVNDMFGTDIKVKFNSSWEDNRIELYLEQSTINRNDEKEDETIEDETIEDATIEDETIEDETIEDEIIEESLTEIEKTLEDMEEKLDDISGGETDEPNENDE